MHMGSGNTERQGQGRQGKARQGKGRRWRQGRAGEHELTRPRSTHMEATMDTNTQTQLLLLSLGLPVGTICKGRKARSIRPAFLTKLCSDGV